MRILGIDPGFGRTGYGLVECRMHGGANFKPLEWGCIETPASLGFAERLLSLSEQLTEVIAKAQPDTVAVEKFFYSKNLNTGIQVAEARGVILLTVAQSGFPHIEITAKEVKAGVCGHGGAKKGEVQRMVQVLLGLDDIPRPDDAADGLAIAISGSSFAIRPQT